MPKLSATGSAVYGSTAIAIDGAAVAALSTYTAGGWGWLTDLVIAGQASVTGSGVWRLYQDVVSSGTVTTLEGAAVGANAFGAGNSVWAAYLAGAGVRSSNGLSLPDAGLGDVSPDGQIVTIDQQQTGVGLSVYNAAGTRILNLPDVALIASDRRLRDNYLSYLDSTGWHLVNVTDGSTPSWYPRIDGVGFVLPVLMGTVLWVIEGNNSKITARQANQPSGFVLESTPVFFNPDAVASSATVLRAAYCANAGESVLSLIVTDLTIATGAYSRHDYATGTTTGTYARTTFDVGPLEGSNLTNGLYLPLTHPVTDRSTGLMTKPWSAALQATNNNLGTVSQYAQNIPVPPAPPASFGTVASPDQVPVNAFTPSDTLTVQSADGSVTLATNPVTRTVDLAVTPGTTAVDVAVDGALDGDGTTLDPLAVRVDGTTVEVNGSNDLALTDTAVTPGTYGDATHVAQVTVDQQGRVTAASDVEIDAGGGSWIPLVDGSEPPAFITDGAGRLIVVAYE